MGNGQDDSFFQKWMPVERNLLLLLLQIGADAATMVSQSLAEINPPLKRSDGVKVKRNKIDSKVTIED